MARRGKNEGSIWKRKDGRWEGRISLESGRRKAFYGSTRREVSRKLNQALRDYESGLPLANERQTVGQFLDRWLVQSAKPRVRPRTFNSYAMHIRLHLKPALGRIRLTKLTPVHVQAMMNEKLDNGLAPATVKRIRATLRCALNQALKWGEVSRNVAKLVDPVKVTPYEVEPFTPEQARQLLDAIRGHRLEALLSVALATGLRQGELLGLRWRDVDLVADPPALTVRYALQRLNGRRQLVEPKSPTSRRSIVLPPMVAHRLREHRAQQNRARLSAGGNWNELDLVFTTGKGTPHAGSQVTRDFQKLLAEIGLPRKRFHDLRHSCATLLQAEGVSPRDIMGILGHSGISVTMNTYAHLLPVTQKDAANRMNRVLWENTGSN